jgi:hypothetical protein
MTGMNRPCGGIMKLEQFDEVGYVFVVQLHRWHEWHPYLTIIAFFALCWVDGKLPSLTEARKEGNSTITKCLGTENELSIIFNLVPSPFSSSFSLLSWSCHIQQLILSLTLKSSQWMTQRCRKYFDVETHLWFEKTPSWLIFYASTLFGLWSETAI